MGDVIKFKRAFLADEQVPMIVKCVDGERIACIELDKLSERDRARYFTGELDRSLADRAARLVLPD